MPVRAFESAYPGNVAGMVLIDVSSEPEVPVYERLDAGPWIDRTDRIDIDATVGELRAAGDLDDIPVVVVTAGIIEDEWLATVPILAARLDAELAPCAEAFVPSGAICVPPGRRAGARSRLDHPAR
jgi:hypothetical protein